MITPAQCRAARGLVDLSQQQLADAAKVGVVTVRQFESGAAQPRNATAEVIQRALESAGVEFTNGGQPGVRMKPMKTNFALDAIANAPIPTEKTDDELFADYLDKGPCVVFADGSGYRAPSLYRALAMGAEFERDGNSVTSILILGQARLGADQARRLAERLRDRPA